MKQYKHSRGIILPLLAALLALTLFPFSALALTENALESVPDFSLPEDELAADEAETNSDINPYLPSLWDLPARGTVSEEEAVRLPRLTDTELERTNRMLAALEAGEELPYQDLQVAGKTEDVQVTVFPLDPADFDGETYAVVLPPYEMSDDQLYSLICAFRQLDIPYRPDALHYRNCVRGSYPRINRYLTDEENERMKNIHRMLIRGMLDKEVLSTETACIAVRTSWEPSYTVWLYPFRRLTDDELTSIVLAEDTLWETDPDQLERAARKAARSILRLPLSMTTAGEIRQKFDNYAYYYNSFDIRYTDTGSGMEQDVTGAPSSLEICHEEYPLGGEPELKSISVWYNIDGDESDGSQAGDRQAHWLLAAEKWAAENLLLPEEKMPARWTVNLDEIDYDYVQLEASTEEWRFELWLNTIYDEIDCCNLYRNYVYYLPYDAEKHPERQPVPEGTAEKELHSDGDGYDESVSMNPWLTDMELARILRLRASLEAGEIRYEGPSVVNAQSGEIGVYPLSPEDFDGETFYVILPEGTLMNDLQLLSLLSAFDELGIPFDPDSLNARNCCRNSSMTETRELTQDEANRMQAVSEQIAAGQITRESIAEDARILVAAKGDTRYADQFCFYPYRRMTDDEIALFVFAGEASWNLDPDLLRKNTPDAVGKLVRIPEGAELEAPVLRSLHKPDDHPWIISDSAEVYEYSCDYKLSELVGQARRMDVRLLQEPGASPELFSISLHYIANGNGDESRPAGTVESRRAAAAKWAAENLLLPYDTAAEWNIGPMESAALYGRKRVSLYLKTPEYIVYLWMYPNSAEIDECVIYSLKWYRVESEKIF